MDEREDFKFRFLELQKPFWSYVRNNNVTPSKAIRHFIKLGLSENKGFNVVQQEQIKQEIIDLKRSHASIGTNLNQVARYFNQNDFLLESDLHKSHQEIQNSQKQITQLLNEVLKHI